MPKYKIVIADDHAMVREGVKNLIKQNRDYEVVAEATNGKEAIALYEKHSPDLLIMDISMPDMNGMEVSKELLEKNEAANIIILSMFDDEEYVSRCLEIGVKGYVIKNESGSELDYAIKSVLQGKNYFSRQAQNVIFKKYSHNIVRKKQAEEVIRLTNREQEVAKLIVQGLSSSEIADKLILSQRTVDTHRANLMKKIGVKNAIELVNKIKQFELL
jgi:DNA-binding NarL/FixJ family response regulator